MHHLVCFWLVCHPPPNPTSISTPEVQLTTGVDLLYKCCEGLINDPTTYEIMIAYLKDEEEDLYWSQGALELIEKIGQQNWLFTQV